MLFRSKFNCLLLLVVVLEGVEADYVPVNWNISTERGNSYFEREYKYPMYEDVAPAPCDLTNSCDVFCRQDPDCDEWQKRSFLEVPANTLCSGPLAFFRCDCDNFDRPEWFSMLCFVFRNPIYLGKFYQTPKKIEKFGGLRNAIDKKQYNMFKHNLNGDEMKSKVISQLGAPVMTFVPVSDSFPSLSPLLIKAPVKEFSYACESKAVRYRINDSTVCLTQISQEQCQNGHALSILSYLVQGDNFSNSGKIPIVLKDLDVLKGTKTNVTIKCVAVKLKSKKFKKQDINYFQEEMSKACHSDFSTYQTYFSNGTCLNVLTSVKYKFTLNGSDVVNLTVEYSLADLPLHFDNNNNKISQGTAKSIYVKQTFGVNFFDILKKSPDTRNFTEGDNLLNRGYFMGEKLNFGYKQ